MSSRGKNGLKDLCVFVVEDEAAVLLMIEDMLMTLGCKVAASACHIGPALATAQSGNFEAAVLDINIAGEAVYPVAEALNARNVPIVFSTGYGISGIDAAWRNWPVLQKPYRIEQLANALKSVTGRMDR